MFGDQSWRAARHLTADGDLDVAVTLAPLVIRLVGEAQPPPGSEVFMEIEGDWHKGPRSYLVQEDGVIEAGRLPLGSYLVGTGAAPWAPVIQIEHSGALVEVVVPLPSAEAGPTAQSARRP